VAGADGNGPRSTSTKATQRCPARENAKARRMSGRPDLRRTGAGDSHLMQAPPACWLPCALCLSCLKSLCY
jgi:hypothetical protein